MEELGWQQSESVGDGSVEDAVYAVGWSAQRGPVPKYMRGFVLKSRVLPMDLSGIDESVSHSTNSKTFVFDAD